MPIVLKSGSLNLLEPSGPVQACNGIALTLRNAVEYFSLSGPRFVDINKGTFTHMFQENCR